MDEVFYYFGVGVVGFVAGFGIAGILPKDFQCTESAVVNGQAECVKYEKKVGK